MDDKNIEIYAKKYGEGILFNLIKEDVEPADREKIICKLCSSFLVTIAIRHSEDREQIFDYLFGVFMSWLEDIKNSTNEYDKLIAFYKELNEKNP